MKKSVTEHSHTKSNSKKLAKKLRDLQSKLSEKTVYAVKKHRGRYEVADVNTNSSIVINLPSYNVADKIATNLNRSLSTPERINTKIKPHLDKYYQQKHELVYFKNILKNSNCKQSRLVIYDRIDDINVKMNTLIEKISSLA